MEAGGDGARARSENARAECRHGRAVMGESTGESTGESSQGARPGEPRSLLAPVAHERVALAEAEVDGLLVETRIFVVGEVLLTEGRDLDPAEELRAERECTRRARVPDERCDVRRLAPSSAALVS